jgi:predicted dehydrogenase
MAAYAADRPGRIELAAACDLDKGRAERFCEDFGFLAAYRDIRRMLPDVRPDACICVLPVEAVVPAAASLLEMGMPCVMEKPLGTCADEAHRLAEVAGRTLTPHMVSMNRRFSPYLNDALAWCRRRGPIRHVQATMARMRRAEPDFIWGTALHLVDAAAYVGGPVTGYRAETVREAEMKGRWYGISIEFAHGAWGQLSVLPTAGYNEETYRISGEGFHAEACLMSPAGPRARCWTDGELQLDLTPDTDELPCVSDGSYHELGHFVDCMLRGARPRPSVEDVLPQMDICFEMAESWAAESTKRGD